MNDVIMPKLGLTMDEGTVQRWLAEEGDRVEAGQPILEVETDKVVVEVEAPAGGVLGPRLVAEGQRVPIGTVLARIYAPGQAMPGAVPPGVPPARAGHAEPDSGIAMAQAGEQRSPGPPARATPLARKIAAESGIGLERIPGSGSGGRVTAEDVQRAAEAGAGHGRRAFSSPRARKRARELDLDWRSLRGTGPRGRVIERDVLRAAGGRRPGAVPSPLSLPDVAWEIPTAVQRVAAERMAASFGAAPHFYLSAEVSANALLEMRERLGPIVEERVGVRLTLTDLLVRLIAAALREHPRANAFWDAEGRRVGLCQRVNVGIATATDAGLVVPVLRDADRKGASEIARERSDLVERARSGALRPDDLAGGTFTLTNLGMYRVDMFQAILNPPQAAILAVGRITERPVVVGGEVVPRPMMTVTLSCDHRVLDGVLGARFLGRVVEMIEEPYHLLS